MKKKRKKSPLHWIFSWKNISPESALHGSFTTNVNRSRLPSLNKACVLYGPLPNFVASNGSTPRRLVWGASQSLSTRLSRKKMFLLQRMGRSAMPDLPPHWFLLAVVTPTCVEPPHQWQMQPFGAGGTAHFLGTSVKNCSRWWAMENPSSPCKSCSAWCTLRDPLLEDLSLPQKIQPYHFRPLCCTHLLSSPSSSFR